MPTIIFSPGAQLSQVDDFPKGTERTVKGAIYVAPGRTSVVSDGEAAWLKSRNVPFRVVGQPLKPPTLPVAAPKPPTPGAGPIGGLPPTPPGPLGKMSEPDPMPDDEP